MYYCNTRYYSSELCRWISIDAIDYLDPSTLDGINIASYCGNNPVLRIDPEGQNWKSYWQYNLFDLVQDIKDRIINAKLKLFGYQMQSTSLLSYSKDLYFNDGTFSIGFFESKTKSVGDNALFYAFSGTAFGTSDFSTIGVGINLWNVFGIEIESGVSSSDIDVAATITFMDWSVSLDVNLFGNTSITIAKTTYDDSDMLTELTGISRTTGFTVGINTITLIFMIAFGIAVGKIGLKFPIYKPA